MSSVTQPQSGTLIVRRSSAERRSMAAEVVNAVREIWGSRELVHQLVLRDIRVRYHQAVMGFAWALFVPMLIVLSGTMVRIAMATVSGHPVTAATIGSTAVKGVMWAFFSGALGTATQSLLANTALFTKLDFPREVLPLSSVAAQGVDTTVGLVALVIGLPFLGLTLTPALAWAPVILVLMLTLTVAASLITSCANLFFRDVKYIVQTFLTFGIFLTPVFFEPAMLGPVLGPLIMLNPVSPLIEAMRLAVIDGHNLALPIVTVVHGKQMLTWSPWYLVYSGACAILGLIAGMRIFRRSAVVFAEYA